MAVCVEGQNSSVAVCAKGGTWMAAWAKEGVTLNCSLGKGWIFGRQFGLRSGEYLDGSFGDERILGLQLGEEGRRYLDENGRSVPAAQDTSYCIGSTHSCRRA